MAKQTNETEVEKLQFQTKDEAKWGSVNFRTNLWTYFFTVNKGKPLTAKDIKLVEKTFRQVQAANEELFADVEIVEGERKSKKAALLDEVGDEVNELLNAKTLKALKTVWTKILDGKYDSLNRKQKKYLNDIKDKRKTELLK